ncbi:hypothetical protein M885DRAFT_558092 [Pelagophyceae sp. CCMP2097]|nr:hypothetical protein M885DRAFT_558092 [Pelagophyceae sp. CCMP2097]|mmetsp:Transcript_14927/g.50033  ORF Transcript_14927/g.50033 Transcript_14927/m.50033 type:complete len:241 (-) Transcript_14927:281-1003(-)
MLASVKVFLGGFMASSSALSWGSRGWNWGSANGAAHDQAMTLRRSLGTTEARAGFLRALKTGDASSDDAKLALGLAFQGAARSSRMPSEFSAAYDALVKGAYETPTGDYELALCCSPAVKRRCLNVRLVIKPDRRAEFLETIAVNARGTYQEPLNIKYTWGEASANTFHFQEQFVGQAGFDAHASAPHFQKWEAFAGSGPFAEPPQVDFFDASSVLADEVPPRTVFAAVLGTLGFVDEGL